MDTDQPKKRSKAKRPLGLVTVDGAEYTIPAACRLKGASSQAVYHHIATKGLSPQQAYDLVRPYAQRGRT